MKIKDILASVGLPNTAAGKKKFYEMYPDEDSYQMAMGGPVESVIGGLGYPYGFMKQGGVPCMNCGGYMQTGGAGESPTFNAAGTYGTFNHQDDTKYYKDSPIEEPGLFGGLFGNNAPNITTPSFQYGGTESWDPQGDNDRGGYDAAGFTRNPYVQMGGTMTADLEGTYPMFNMGGGDLSMSDFRKYLGRVKKEGGASFPGEGEQDIIAKRKGEFLQTLTENYDNHVMNTMQEEGFFADGGSQDNGMNALMNFLSQRGQGDGYTYMPYNRRGYGMGKSDFKRFSQLPASTQFQGISKVNYGMLGRLAPRFFGPKSIEFNTRNAYENNMQLQPTDDASVRKMLKMKGKQKTSSYGDGQGPYPETEQTINTPAPVQSQPQVTIPSQGRQDIITGMGDPFSENYTKQLGMYNSGPNTAWETMMNTPQPGPRNNFGYGGQPKYYEGGPGVPAYGANRTGPSTKENQWMADDLNSGASNLQPKTMPGTLFQNYLDTDPVLKQQNIDNQLLRDPATNKPYQDNTFTLKKDSIFDEQFAIGAIAGMEGLTSLKNASQRKRDAFNRSKTSTFGTTDQDQAAVDFRGDYRKNFGDFRIDQMVPIKNTGQSYTTEPIVEFGGNPFMRDGGRTAPSANFWTASQINKAAQAFEYSEPDIDVNRTLSAVDRSKANLEAEGGETAIVNVKGIPTHFDINGPRHTNGGVPLNLPEDSFIFSDTKKMMVKGGDVLKQFGMTPKKGGYTPADIAKKITGGKYDMNYYRGVLADKDSSTLQRKTAETMIANYNLKLAKLGLVQESIKGFPQGIPKIAEPWMASMEINPEELLQPQGQQDQPNGDMTAKFGGGLPKAQDGVGSVAAAIAAKKAARAESIAKNQENYLAAEKDYMQTRESNELRDLYKKAQERVAAGDIEPFMDWLPFNTPSAQTYLGEFESKAKTYRQDPKALIAQYEKLNTPVKTIAKAAAAPVVTNAKGIDVANAHTEVAPKDTTIEKSSLGSLSLEQLKKLKADKLAGKYNITYKQEGGDLTQYKEGDEVDPLDAAIAAKEKGVTKGVAKPVNAGQISPYSDVDITPFLSDEQLPYIRKEAVQNFQPKTGEGIYGKGVSREEFLKRNPKWAAAHPEFTTGKEHVGAFQNIEKGYNPHVEKIAYEDAIAKGYPEEMAKKLAKAWVNTQGFHASKKGKYDPTTPDLAFGEFTSSRFEPSFKPYKKTEAPVTQKKAEEIAAAAIVPGKPIINRNVQGAAPWWLQDQITVGADAANFFRVKKHDPWQMKGQVAPYNPTFYDPTRELAANAEMANIGTQGLNAFTNPQAFNAGFSQIQGQGAKNAADILGRYNNQNVTVANDFEVRNKNLMNDASRYNAGLDTNFYNDTVRSQQDFENSKGIRRDMMVNHYKNAITNKMNTANLNDLYDQYKIDPRTGGRIRWTNGKPIKPEAQTDQWDSMASAVKRLTENGQFTRAEAIKIVTGQGGKNAGNSMAYNPMEGSYPMRTAADTDDTNS